MPDAAFVAVLCGVFFLGGFVKGVIGLGLPTVAMGLLPGYARWGLAASGCMVLLRLVQGFCLGGELPGAITYVDANWTGLDRMQAWAAKLGNQPAVA